MPGPFKFKIENARCFRETSFAPITPITFLVGENSSGKTSFVALLFETVSFFQGAFIYNEETIFDLGSFDDLIHRGADGSRSGREFTAGFEIPAAADSFKDMINSPPVVVRSYLTFGEYRGERVVNRVKFEIDSDFIEFRRTEKSMVIDFGFGGLIKNARVTFPTKATYRYLNGGAYELRRTLDALRQALRGKTSDLATSPVMSKEMRSDVAGSTNQIAIAMRCLELCRDYFAWMIRPTAPIRSAPKRVYLIGSGNQPSSADRVPLALNQLKLYEPETWTRLKRRLDEFGKATGLFDELEVQRLRGRKQDAPFELIIRHGAVESNIKDVGYGISQVIPFVVDLILAGMSIDDVPARFRSNIFYIQQPEIHLHPAAQAALGTFLYNYSKQSGQYFIIETHSDFIIDRMRQEIRRAKDNTSNCSLLFFEEKDGSSEIHQIKFDGRGNIIDAPTGYRKFFLEEEGRNFGL